MVIYHFCPLCLQLHQVRLNSLLYIDNNLRELKLITFITNYITLAI